MKIRTVALAAVSTALGIAVVQATDAVSALSSSASTAGVPSVPRGYSAAEVLRVVPTDSGPVVLLSPSGSSEALPIWVGPTEGLAIERAQRGVRTPRPMTHDLFAEVLGSQLHHVRVDRLRPDGVYTGTLSLAGPEGVRFVDARPSDALALALRTGKPVYVNEGLREHMMHIDRLD